MRGDRRFRSVLARMWRALWKGKVAIVVAMVATVGSAVALTLSHDQPYRAEAAMLVQRLPSDVDRTDDPLDHRDRLLNEIAVMEGTEVADRVRADLDIVGALPQVHGYLGTETGVIVARVDSRSSEVAASLANAYLEAYIAVQTTHLTESYGDAIDQLQTQVSELDGQIDGLPDDDPRRADLVDQRDTIEGSLQLLSADLAVARAPAQIVRPAFVPSEPIDGDLGRAIVLSLAVGALLSVIGVALLNRHDPAVRDADDLRNLRSTEPLLAVLPNDRWSETAPVVERQRVGRLIDAYETLRTVVQRIIVDRNVQVIQCCSPSEGEGATSTAVNLAVMLARAGANVALVDLDLHHAQVHLMLGLDLSPGVTDALAEDRDDTGGIRALARLDTLDRDPSGSLIRPRFTEIEGVVEPLGSVEAIQLDPAPVFLPIAYYEDLTVITAGAPPRSALEVLSRSRLRDLIGDLRGLYNIVILVSPSVSVGGDAAAIARHADGAVMVVKAGSTTLPQLRQSLGAIEHAGARILGVVLTGSAS